MERFRGNGLLQKACEACNENNEASDKQALLKKCGPFL